MQPDPAVFLPAIRRAILREDLFGDALKEGLSPILMYRAGEGLAQLALRYGELPGMIRVLRSAQRSILRRAMALLEADGLPLPERVAAALAVPAPRGSAGEDDVRGYELLVEGISAAISALSSHTDQTRSRVTKVRRLCISASRLESQMRTAYKSALERLKAQIGAGARPASAAVAAPDEANLTAILREHFPQFTRIEARNVRRIPGVNAQEIYFFDLMNHPDWEGPMVLRRASGYNPTRACIADEFDLLNYLNGHGLPVPAVLLVERNPTRMGGVFLMMRRLPGSAQAPETIAGHGTTIALRMAEVLAKIHQVDASELAGPHRDDGQPVRRRMGDLIDRFYSRWQAERIEGSLALESAFAWMRANIECLEGTVSLVHGDCNFRNILLDQGRVSAVLDWELAHLGSAAEDLSYIRPDAEKLVPWADFLAAYIAAGGKQPSEQALRYFKVWTNVWRTSMAACVYGSYIRREHDNFIFATVAFNEYYTTLDDLCVFMVEEA
jgi:aminoglycoside phosphotransferase (APT) family kinase protein